MTCRPTLVLLLGLLIVVGATPSYAQDAAETAIILGGSSTAQAKAQRSIGSAAAGSIGRAANAFQASSKGGQGHWTNNQKAAKQMIMLPGKVDPLDGADAATYRLANGASIKVSGSMRPNSHASCTENCTAHEHR